MSKLEKIVFDHGVCNLHSGEHTIDFLGIDRSDAVINIEVNSLTGILITSVKDIKTLTVNVDTSSYLVLSFLFDTEILDPLKITINVKGNSTVTAYFAEFAKDKLNLDCEVNLIEENAIAHVKVASLSSKKDEKNISVSINHLVAKTYGKVDNYGVCKDMGKLLFSGTSHIYKDAIKSKTEQNAKIMVFDEASDAIAKPILKIDENDIEASHAAAVGKINDEHLFYLTSRGLSIADAKELITLGYLKPILAGFTKQETKDYISSLIERRM